MIRQFDEPLGQSRQEPDTSALLASVERVLSKKGRIADEKAYEAQQLVYDAWEAPTDESERDMIFQALRIDPGNVDALLQAAVYTGVDGEAEIDLLRKIVAVAEKNLGPKVFKE